MPGWVPSSGMATLDPKTADGGTVFCSGGPRLRFYGSSRWQAKTRPAGSNSSPAGRGLSPRTATAWAEVAAKQFRHLPEIRMMGRMPGLVHGSDC